MRTLTAFVLFIVLGSIGLSQEAGPAPQPADTSDPFSPKSLFQESVKGVPCKIPDRRDGVKKLFLSAGAKEDDIKVEPFDKDRAANVVVRLAGSPPRRS